MVGGECYSQFPLISLEWWFDILSICIDIFGIFGLQRNENRLTFQKFVSYPVGTTWMTLYSLPNSWPNQEHKAGKGVVTVSSRIFSYLPIGRAHIGQLK